MRATISTAILGMALVSCAIAAPPLTIPDEVKPTQGYAILRPDTTCKTVSYIGLSGVYPLPAELLADKRTFVLPVNGLAAGRYRFVAVGSLDDDHAVKEFVVVVGDAPPVPVPGPGPTPPGPSDPLATRLTEAVRSSGFTKSKGLATGLDLCANLAEKANNSATFFEKAQTFLKASVNDERLPPAIATILGEETGKVLPTDPARQWTSSEQQAAKAMYERLANAMRIAGGVGK